MPDRNEFGFNLLAFASGNFGLAVAGRATIRLLLDHGYAISVRDVDTHDDRSGQDRTFDDLYIRRPWGLPYGITIFHLNPPELEVRIPLEWLFLPLDKRMNVIVPFWELPTLPDVWRRTIADMDVVLAPTLYIRDIIERELPGTRVVHYPQAVEVPAGTAPDRARFGIPEDTTVFLSAFDMASDIHRKNPWSAIDAFEEAFPQQGTAALVVKVNNADLWDHALPLLKRLRERADANPAILLVDETMSYADALSLYASCDVFVSLHRAEGLGLILMEMMSLGKPVIATAWSGNMDFMTREDSCLVGYDMVPVEATHVSYREEADRAVWADPRVDEAARWMRRLADDPALRAAIGARAASAMAERRTSAMRIEPFERLRDIHESGAYLDGHTERAARIRRQRITGLVRLVPRIMRSLLRRARRRILGVH